MKRGNLLDAYPNTMTKEKLVARLLLEIVLAGAVMRFQVQAEKFLFRYLGDRHSVNPADNFALLVQDLMNYAPRALVNRGAFSIRENRATVFGYPSKNAFYEEMTWMLWQTANARQA
jgi:adenylate kinase family enzyme